MTFNVTLHRFH